VAPIAAPGERAQRRYVSRWLLRRSPLPAPSAPTSPRKRGEVQIW